MSVKPEVELIFTNDLMYPVCNSRREKTIETVSSVINCYSPLCHEYNNALRGNLLFGIMV